MDWAVTCFFSITYSTYSRLHCSGKLHKKLSFRHDSNESAVLHRICCQQSGDKIFRIWFPCCVYIFPCCKDWHRNQTEDMQIEKAANRHLLIPVSCLCLSPATGGIVSVDYDTVSHVVIKPNQETPKGSKVEEEKERGSEAEQGVCCREGKKKIFWKVHWGRFLWRAVLGLTTGDQKQLCVTGADSVFSRPVSLLTFKVRMV